MMFSLKLLMLATQLTAGILLVAGLPSSRSLTPSSTSLRPSLRPSSPSYFDEHDNNEDEDIIATDNYKNLFDLHKDYSPKQNQPQIKRSMGMLRMGRAPASRQHLSTFPDSVEALRTSGLIGGVEGERSRRAMMSMLRMGRSSDDREAAKRSMMSMLRMGRSHEGVQGESDEVSLTPERRSMAMLRLGRQSGASRSEEKRTMAMLRLGRSSVSDGDDEKRSMSMLRMG